LFTYIAGRMSDVRSMCDVMSMCHVRSMCDVKSINDVRNMHDPFIIIHSREYERIEKYW